MKMKDVTSRGQQEAERLVKKMVAAAKKDGYIGHVEHTVSGRTHTVTIENSNGGIRVMRLGENEPGYGFSSTMEEIVRASAVAIFVSRDEHPGHFDWAADTYIKDASSVEFNI